MQILFTFKKEDNSQITIKFVGTEKECEIAKRWPSYVTTPEGQEFIRRFAADPAQEAWETYCASPCG